MTSAGIGVVRAGRKTRTLRSRPSSRGLGGPLATGALIVTLPVLVLTVFVQREIDGGLAAGAVKGGRAAARGIA